MRLRGHMTALSEGPTAQVNNIANTHTPHQEHQEKSSSDPGKNKIRLRKYIQRNRPTDYESFMTFERWNKRCTVCTRIGHKGRVCKFHTNLCALCGEMDSNNHVDFTKCERYGIAEPGDYHCNSNWAGNPAKATICIPPNARRGRTKEKRYLDTCAVILQDSEEYHSLKWPNEC